MGAIGLERSDWGDRMGAIGLGRSEPERPLVRPCSDVGSDVDLEHCLESFRM